MDSEVSPRVKSLPATLAARVLEIEDYDGDRLIVTTAHGWAFAPSEDERSAEHTRGADNMRGVRTLLLATRRCSCGRCQRRG